MSVNSRPGGCVIGIDFGTLSGRAVVVRVADGALRNRVRAGVPAAPGPKAASDEP